MNLNKKGSRKQKVLKTNVVSFRLTADQQKRLVKAYTSQPPVYVKSEKHFARKILADFLAGRLIYKNNKHALVDVDIQEAVD